MEDPNEPEAELILRFSRRGWMEGRLTLEGTDAVIMVTENAMDGVCDRAVSWALASADSADDVLLSGFSRSLEEHTWLFEQAYRVEEVDVSGRRVVLALFIDFETTWCGPCKIMDEWVYTADQVVDASTSVIALKVDGDDFPDLKARFGVEGFPTMVLLDPSGTELRRLSGYVNEADMTAFMEGTE